MSRSELNASLRVRPLSTADVASLLHIQTVCYGSDFLETHAIFAQRLGCPYHCSIGVVRSDAADPALLAYLAAYWSNPGKITPLNGPFTAPAAGEQVLYVHDMSVLPALAGQGVATHLLQRLLQHARDRQLRHAALVSVQGSQAYWERQGFRVTDVLDAQQMAHLKTYGEGACYMCLPL